MEQKRKIVKASPKGIETHPQITKQVLADFIKRFEDTYGGRVWVEKFVWFKGENRETNFLAVFKWLPSDDALCVTMRFQEAQTISPRRGDTYELAVLQPPVYGEGLSYDILAYFISFFIEVEGLSPHEKLKKCLETLVFRRRDDKFAAFIKLFTDRRHMKIHRFLTNDLVALAKGEHKGWKWRLKLSEFLLDVSYYSRDIVYTYLKVYTHVVFQKGLVAAWLPIAIAYHIESTEKATGKFGVFIPIPPLEEEENAATLLVVEPFTNLYSRRAGDLFQVKKLGELEKDARTLDVEERAEGDVEIVRLTQRFPVSKENLAEAIGEIARNVIDVLLEPGIDFGEARQKAVKALGFFIAFAVILKRQIAPYLRPRMSVSLEREKETRVYRRSGLISLEAAFRLYIGGVDDRAKGNYVLNFKGQEKREGFTLSVSVSPVRGNHKVIELQQSGIDITDKNQLKQVLRYFAEEARAKLSEEAEV